MTIRPNPVVPINMETTSAIELTKFPIYQTRTDYAAEHGGEEPPDPAQSIRRKHWYDPRYKDVNEDNGEVAVYTVIASDIHTGKPLLGEDGKPYLTQLIIPQFIAGRVNIPTGIANEFAPSTTILRLAPYPFPVRPLDKDEELAMPDSPFGGPMVVNRALKAQRMTTIKAKLEGLLADLRAIVENL